MAEFNAHAADSLRANAARHGWPQALGDVRDVSWREAAPVGLSLVAGGPPCQPFSFGGKAEGSADAREMWPEAIRAVRELQPEAFLFENVKGLLRPVFADYVSWVTEHLARPLLPRRTGESHAEHLARISRMEKDYDVSAFLLDAADYGVPQRRHRVFFVGMRRDLGAAFVPPQPTHSRARLAWDKWATGEYWESRGLRRPEPGRDDAPEIRIAEQALKEGKAPGGAAWRTCRDAFAGLGEPRNHDGGVPTRHRFQPGARSYGGHSGSRLDGPSKALKAGVHGVPGGENMVIAPEGCRYFTVREAARLQGIPDDYDFPGSWSQTMRQLGNAVPTGLARAVGAAVALALAEAPRDRRLAA
jgi:DNA (cytosine-5)-methyltransferase 1